MWAAWIRTLRSAGSLLRAGRLVEDVEPAGIAVLGEVEGASRRPLRTRPARCGRRRPVTWPGRARRSAAVRPASRRAASDRSGRLEVASEDLCERDHPAEAQGPIRVGPLFLQGGQGLPSGLAEPREQRPGLRGRPLVPADHGQVLQASRVSGSSGPGLPVRDASSSSALDPAAARSPSLQSSTIRWFSKSRVFGSSGPNSRRACSSAGPIIRNAASFFPSSHPKLGGKHDGALRGRMLELVDSDVRLRSTARPSRRRRSADRA